MISYNYHFFKVRIFKIYEITNFQVHISVLLIILTLLYVALIHGPNIPGSYKILIFTTSDFTSIACHSHNWVLFLLWLCLFTLSGVISPLFSSRILGTYPPGEFIFQCHTCFILLMGFSRQEYWSGLLLPSLLDHRTFQNHCKWWLLLWT